MKKTLLSLIGVATAALGSCPAFGDAPYSHCSLASLHGTYAYGYVSSNVTDTYRYSSSGMESYDGEGHLTWYQIWSDSSGTYTYSGTGTYSFTTLTDNSGGVAVTASCVAKVSYSGYSTWTYFVAPDGGAYFYNGNTSSSLGGGEVKRISLALLVK
jgi:hypothetical protein